MLELVSVLPYGWGKTDHLSKWGFHKTFVAVTSEVANTFLGANASFNPRLTGVSAERHWPGGGAYNAPPGQANSQTNDHSETGEAALERSRRDGSKELLKFFLKGHVSGQGLVKG